MKLSVTDNRTGEETICCLTHASFLIGIEEKSIYDKLKPENHFTYRHFYVNAKIKIVKNKPRGKCFSKQNQI
jgi:hypothetical protein